MEKLKLSVVPDDKPVKVTIDLPAAVHRDLVAYAEAIAGRAGRLRREPAKLIVPMVQRSWRLTGFLQNCGRRGSSDVCDACRHRGDPRYRSRRRARNGIRVGLLLACRQQGLETKPRGSILVVNLGYATLGYIAPVAPSSTSVSPRPLRPDLRADRYRRYVPWCGKAHGKPSFAIRSR